MNHPGVMRVWRAAAALELPVVLALAPVLLFPTPGRLALLGVLPLVWIGLWMTRQPLVPRTPANVALGLLLVMVGVSAWATFDLTFSLGKISGVVLGVLLFWAAARWLTSPARLKVGVALFLAAGAGLAVIGLLGTNWVGKYVAVGGLVERLPRVIRGLPGAEEGFSPNAVAGCLVLFVPLQAALIASAAGRAWWGRAGGSSRRAALGAQGGLLLLTGGTLLLTQSRSAWAGIAMAAAVGLLYWNRWTRLLTAFALVAGSAAAFLLVNWPTSVFVRFELWSRAIDAIGDFPITGMGMNAFRKVMPALYPSLLSSPDLDVVHAHNQWLQAALDLGLPGLIAYVALWLILGALVVAVCRRASDAIWRIVAAGLGGGLVAHFVFGMTDAIPLGAKVGVLFWLTAALTVGTHHVVLAASREMRDA